MLTKQETESLKLGEQVAVCLNGIVGEFPAVVVDEKGTDGHPGPWLRLRDDDPSQPVLKEDDFRVTRRL